MDFHTLFRYCPQCGADDFRPHSPKSKCCAKCGFVYFVNPSASTVAVITNERNELLVVKRAKEPARGTLDLPGGFSDAGETSEEGVRREVKEETGLDVVRSEYLFSLPNLYQYCGLDIPTLDMFYRCEVADTAQACGMDDASEAQWIPLAEVRPEQFGLTSIRRGVEKLLASGLAAFICVLAFASCGKRSGTGEAAATEALPPITDTLELVEPEPAIQPAPDTTFASVDLIRWDYTDFTADDTTFAWPSPELAYLTNDYEGGRSQLTFRSQPSRNANFGGRISGTPSRIEKDWTFTTSNGYRSTTHGSWGGGSGWTGQPLYVEWPDSVYQRMKRSTPGLTEHFGQRELIVTSLTGEVYFLDPETGKPTRESLDAGNVIKGTASLDPSMNGNYYVGQGVAVGATFGCEAFNLYTMQRFFFKDRDPKAWRGWGAYDSSPIVVGGFLFWPGENGTIYKYYRCADKENTLRLYGTLRYSPRGSYGAAGIESSMAVWRNYGYVADNHGYVVCVNLNTMHPVWVYRNVDDTDSSPVVTEEEGMPYVYTGCEVDRQGDGHPSRFVKINGLTGEEVWADSVVCKRWHVSDSKVIDGGIYATPLPGQGNCSHLIFVPYCLHGKDHGAFYAYDRRTGKVVYRTQLRSYAWSSPVAFYNEQDEMFIVQCDCWGYVYLLRGIDGEVLFSEQLGMNFESSPVVFDNHFVVGSRGNDIYKFSVK